MVPELPGGPTYIYGPGWLWSGVMEGSISVCRRPFLVFSGAKTDQNTPLEDRFGSVWALGTHVRWQLEVQLGPLRRFAAWYGGHGVVCVPPRAHFRGKIPFSARKRARNGHCRPPSTLVTPTDAAALPNRVRWTMFQVERAVVQASLLAQRGSERVRGQFSAHVSPRGRPPTPEPGRPTTSLGPRGHLPEIPALVLAQRGAQAKPGAALGANTGWQAGRPPGRAPKKTW